MFDHGIHLRAFNPLTCLYVTKTSTCCPLDAQLAAGNRAVTSYGECPDHHVSVCLSYGNRQRRTRRTMSGNTDYDRRGSTHLLQQLLPGGYSHRSLRQWRASYHPACSNRLLVALEYCSSSHSLSDNYTLDNHSLDNHSLDTERV
jgi:hypothetical protein